MRPIERRIVCAAMRALVLGLSFVLATTQALPCAFAATSDECISELAVAVGQDGIAQLQEEGFTVMMRPLCEGGEAYLAYKCGGAPITGIALGFGAGGLSMDGVGYDLVANVDVCAGVSDARYVYATHDKSVGTGVLCLKLESGGGHVDDVPFAIKNDGLSPVRDQDGRVAVLGAGVPTYLYMLHKQVCRPYISEARAVSGKDLQDAVLAAANLGYDYYYDTGLNTTTGDHVVLGYVRTKKAGDAITCVTARPAEQKTYKVGGVSFDLMGNVTLEGEEPYRLFCTTDPLAGNPIVDFTGSDVPVRSTDVMGKWVDRTFVKFASASAGSEAKGEKLYGELLASKEALTNVAVYEAKNTAASKNNEDDANVADDEKEATKDGDDQATLELGDGKDVAEADRQEGDAAIELSDPTNDESAQDEIAIVEVEAKDESDGSYDTDMDVATQSVSDAAKAVEEDPMSSVPKTPLAYVCVAKDLPTSLFVPAKKDTTKTESKKKDDSKEDKDAKKDDDAQSIELGNDDSTTSDANDTSDNPDASETVALEEVQQQQQAQPQEDEQPQDVEDSQEQDLVLDDVEYVDEEDSLGLLGMDDSQMPQDDQPELMEGDGEEVVLVASTFGDGAASTLVTGGCMAAVGALGGFGVYKVRHHRDGGKSHDEQE